MLLQSLRHAGRSCPPGAGNGWGLLVGPQKAQEFGFAPLLEGKGRGQSEWRHLDIMVLNLRILEGPSQHP